jgi:predicted ATPase
MIFLSELWLKEDLVFEKSRESHDKFQEKIYTVPKGYRDSGKKIVQFLLFKKNLKVNLNKDISIIVGDNGTGKTTLLKFLKLSPFHKKTWNENDEEYKIRIQKELGEYIESNSKKLTFVKNPSGVLFMDALHKSIVGKELGDKMGESIATGKDMMKHVGGFFAFQNNSNGEALLDLYRDIDKIKNSVIVMDEPETSLSLKNITLLRDTLLKLKENNQIIISTHHPIFISMTDELFDVEKKKLINTKTYLKQFKLDQYV